MIPPMRVLDFDVNGEPAPQGSKRHVGKGVMIESSKKLKPWREAVIWAVKGLDTPVAPFLGPLEISCIFRLHKPKCAKAFALPDKTPDLDKLLRSTWDALKIAGIIKDDAQFIKTLAFKLYARPGESTGCRIVITTVY